MKHPLLCLIFLLRLLGAEPAAAQMSPTDRDTINQIHYLFEVPYYKDAAVYELTIKNKSKKVRSVTYSERKTENYFMVKSGLQFGHDYLWNYTCYDKNGKLLFKSNDWSLYIRGNWQADSNRYRNVIDINKSEQLIDGYILLDNGTIIDRKGKTIWTFPKDYVYKAIRNMEIGNDGNITFINDENCYEADLKGNILWTPPTSINGMPIVNYHHTFHKLENGNFLCVAEKKTIGKPYNIVFEITRENEIKWLWDEEPYHRDDPSFTGSHLNAAYYDLNHKILYLSLRDLDAVAAIDVTNNKMLYSIGYDYKQGIPYYTDSFFNLQHAVSLTQNDELLLFNNNAKKNPQPSSVVIFSKPSPGNPPKLKWEYSFHFPKKLDNLIDKFGDVDEMTNGNLMICLGKANHIFEVSRQKEILWDCLTEKADSGKGFTPYPTMYRSAFSTTLFPCAFIAYIMKGDTSNMLCIKNIGTTEDSYRIDFEGEIQTTKLVIPGETWALPLNQHHSVLTITSVRNIKKVKKITFD